MDLSIAGAAGDRTLNFFAPALAGAASSTVAISVVGTASRLTLTTQPSPSAASGVDAAGSAVNQAGVDVTVGIVTGGGTLGGTLTASTNASGVATFTDLTTSNAVNITPGPATQLTITTQPSASAASGVAFVQQPLLQLRDAAGNAVSQASRLRLAADLA